MLILVICSSRMDDKTSFLLCYSMLVIVDDINSTQKRPVAHFTKYRGEKTIAYKSTRGFPYPIGV